MSLNYSKDRDKKVEFKTEPFLRSPEDRKIFYRIVPSELNWWKRRHSNPWTPMYRALRFVGGTINSFNFNQYHELIFPLKTYGDVADFLTQQEEIGEKISEELENIRQERIANGEEWPD